MLLKQENKLKLKPPMPKILCISTAYNDTFVILRLDALEQKETIVHLNKDGKILWEKQYSSSLKCFGMMNQRQVIVLNVPEGKIDIINLYSQSVLEVNHEFMFEDTAYLSIQTFPDSDLFCIVEKGGINDNRLRLTYFNYIGICEKSQPLTQWQSSQNEWTYDHETCKLNNHSKIGWWMYHHEKEIEFSFFDLKQDKKGIFATIKVNNNIGEEYDLKNIELDISNLWESLPNQYMIIGLSTKIDHPHKCTNKKGIINNNFVIDAQKGNQKAFIRQTNFFFEKDSSGFNSNDHLIDCYGLGSFSVFPTIKNHQGQTLESPIFYVMNETQIIVAKDTWKCSCFSANYFFPGWDGSVMIQAEHTNADCSEVTVTTRKLLNIKEISLQFLLHINEDFDDDLLLDATILLENSYDLEIK